MERPIVVIQIRDGELYHVSSNYDNIGYVLINLDNINNIVNGTVYDVDSTFTDVKKYIDQVFDDFGLYNKRFIIDNPKSLKDFFESKGFKVDEDYNDDYVGMSILTYAGVEMLVELSPFNKKSFIEYVDKFSIDEEIDFLRNTDKNYVKKFTIKESLIDFEDYKLMLDKIVNELK